MDFTVARINLSDSRIINFIMQPTYLIVGNLSNRQLASPNCFHLHFLCNLLSYTTTELCSLVVAVLKNGIIITGNDKCIRSGVKFAGESQRSTERVCLFRVFL